MEGTKCSETKLTPMLKCNWCDKNYCYSKNLKRHEDIKHPAQKSKWLLKKQPKKVKEGKLKKKVKGEDFLKSFDADDDLYLYINDDADADDDVNKENIPPPKNLSENVRT